MTAATETGRPAHMAAGIAHRRRDAIFNRSSLARNIVVINLLALLVLVGAVLLVAPFRTSLGQQGKAALLREAHLVARTIEARLSAAPPSAELTASQMLSGLEVTSADRIFVFDGDRRVVAFATLAEGQGDAQGSPRRAPITDALVALRKAAALLPSDQGAVTPRRNSARALLRGLSQERAIVDLGRDDSGQAVIGAVVPVTRDGQTIGVVGLASRQGETDRLVRAEREKLLQIFLLAIAVSVGLSLLLASTIANPLADLAAAVEVGRERNADTVKPARVLIPDLTHRADEIGRLSGALRGMVAALYDRIEANEQFAADVAHEIKNPLASLRSAVGSLRIVRKEEHRKRLLDLIEHDVRRLDRLVSDISNASRLDSELVKEDEERFDLLELLRNLTDHLGGQAAEKGIHLIADLPEDPLPIEGLESRMAQVFVNLITNAISFCGEGDAIRVWARRRDNRVLVVVEDTGPGIPESALSKIFDRFYSERPPAQFGDNSGLGLAISKQIVEAHGGVIWAENISPVARNASAATSGARFVVGLPV